MIINRNDIWINVMYLVAAAFLLSYDRLWINYCIYEKL